jgi:drug/metabolite transporter (DMT)-like permease
MLVALAAVARRPPLRVSPLDGTVIAVAGVADMVGNLLYAAASSRGGLVSIVSVLASLYPVVTIVLARTVLGERVAPSQDAGILLTLAGVALISIG